MKDKFGSQCGANDGANEQLADAEQKMVVDGSRFIAEK